MYLDQLKVFCDLAETGSFSKAGVLHGITEQTLTQQVHMLEQELQVALLTRDGSKIGLTAEGTALCEAARQMLKIYRDLGARLQALRNRVSGELRIASTYSIGLNELPPRLKMFRGRHPDVEVHVEFRRSTEVYEQVLAGGSDLGLVAYPRKRPGLRVDIFEEDEMVLICHPTHRLAKESAVTAAQLQSEKFISFEPDQATRKMIDRFFRSQHVEVANAMEFESIETLKHAVEVESGISLVPAGSVRREVAGGSLASVSLSGPRLSRPLGVITQSRRAHTPPEAEFLKALRSGTDATELSSDFAFGAAKPDNR
jgi:DNA-binding transcriptional LysR family regulator